MPHRMQPFSDVNSSFLGTNDESDGSTVPGQPDWMYCSKLGSFESKSRSDQLLKVIQPNVP